MTRKLIEALNKCETRKSYENVRYTLVDDELRDYIEESLERLEVLEKENQELWKNIEKYNHKFAEVERKKCDLQQENEKLLVNKNVAQVLAIKYKKAIEILNDKMPIQFLGYNKYGAKPYEIISNGFVIGLEQQEYDLLKEVLGNE